MWQVVPPKDRFLHRNESLDVLLRLIEMNVFAKCYPTFHRQLFSDLHCRGSTSKLYFIVPMSDVMVCLEEIVAQFFESISVNARLTSRPGLACDGEHSR